MHSGEGAVHRVRRETDRLEAATLESEISMSVATDDTRPYYGRDRRESILRRLITRYDSTVRDEGYEDEKPQCCNGAVNVEPVLFLIALCGGVFLTSQPLFTYWARCIEIVESDPIRGSENASAICASLSLGNNTELLDRVETDISQTKIWLQVTSSLPTLIAAPLVGTWSDRRGRKAPLIFTMVGFTLYMVFWLLATLMYKSISIYPWCFLSEGIIGCFGGASQLFGTMLAIVTDDCRHKLKPGSSSVPLRIGVASAIQSLGSLVGSVIVSWLSVPALVDVEGHAQSYVRAAVLQTVICAAALLYTILFVRETHHPGKHRRLEEDEDDVPASVEFRGDSLKERVARNAGALWEVLSSPRPGWSRFCLNLTLCFVFVEFLALDSGLLFLLVKRQPFAWSDKMFSNFSIVKGIAYSLGMMLCPLALVKINMLGKDSVLILMGVAASCASFFMFSFATTTYQIFITAALSLLCGAIAPGYRTFLPRMVPKEQTARLLTVVSIVMAFCPIVSALVFNNLFTWSLSFWPGFAFFVGAIFQLVVVFGQILIHFLMRPQWKAEKEAKLALRVSDFQGIDNPNHVPVVGAAGREEDEREGARSASTATTSGSLRDEVIS